MNTRPSVERVGVLRRLCKRLGAALTVLAIVQCRPEHDAASDYPRRETFYVGGPQWGEPSSFNPLKSSPDWPVKDEYLLMYQTLLVYDPMTGKMEPLLAESLRQTDRALEVTIQERARWSDGRPVLADDVAYTFNLGRKHKGISQGPLWVYLDRVRVGSIEDVLALRDGTPPAGERRVTFLLKPENQNPLVVLDQFRQVRILPRHIIEPMLAGVGDNMGEFLKNKMDKDPVISGPYQLHSYSSEKIALVRRDDYWGNDVFHAGKKAVPKYVIHPVYKSNDHYSIALQQGRMDVSSSFVPRIWLKHKKGVRTWFDEPPYFVTTSMPMMLINVARAPLDDVHYRRAMAFAINYKDIRELAVSGYSEALVPGAILPFGPESRFFSKEDAERYGASVYDVERARAELQNAGYQSIFDEHGELVETRDKTGQRVRTVYIKSPTGWTDWEAIVRIAVRGMREAGIDARERFIDAAVFWQSTALGDFDLIMNTPASPPTPSKPWSRFEAVLTSKDFAPLGERMYKNQGRFNDPTKANYEPRFEQLLSEIPKMRDEVALSQAYRELNVMFMQHQPTLPLVYRSHSYYEFSTRVWTGLPTSKDPYLPPLLPGEGRGVDTLWHVRLAVD
jgi:peptide/nickel transport system substrate-binding protein